MLVTEPHRLRTPHGISTLVRIRLLLGGSGALELFREEWLAGLLSKLDGSTRARVLAALNPPELLVPALDPHGRTKGEGVAAVMAEIKGQSAQLPPVGSPAGQAVVRANQAASGYRGPIDWPR